MIFDIFSLVPMCQSPGSPLVAICSTMFADSKPARPGSSPLWSGLSQPPGYLVGSSGPCCDIISSSNART
jgi:hypothetical protein